MAPVAITRWSPGSCVALVIHSLDMSGSELARAIITILGVYTHTSNLGVPTGLRLVIVEGWRAFVSSHARGLSPRKFWRRTAMLGAARLFLGPQTSTQFIRGLLDFGKRPAADGQTLLLPAASLGRAIPLPKFSAS